MGLYAGIYLVTGLLYGALMEYLLTKMAESENEAEKMQAEIMLNSPGYHGLALTAFILLWPVWVLTSIIAGAKGLDN